MLAVATVLAACSSPDDSGPDDGTDGGTDAGAPLDANGAAILLEPGVYNGPTQSAETALAVWSDEQRVGRLFAGDGLGFDVSFPAGEGALLTPLDGVCEMCGDGPWVVDIERLIGEAGWQYRLTVVDDAVGAGFDSLIMVPSDGFKPEFAPAQEFDVWVGDFFALAPAVSPAVLQSQCELSVNRASGAIESFSCQNDDSTWSSEVADSWDGQGGFETEAARFVGEFGGDPSFETFEGQVLVGDDIVGAFEAVKL